MVGATAASVLLWCRGIRDTNVLHISVLFLACGCCGCCGCFFFFFFFFFLFLSKSFVLIFSGSFRRDQSMLQSFLGAAAVDPI
jgi:hypothetical protein